jgi:hypothetical protein
MAAYIYFNNRTLSYEAGHPLTVNKSRCFAAGSQNSDGLFPQAAAYCFYFRGNS